MKSEYTLVQVKFTL